MKETRNTTNRKTLTACCPICRNVLFRGAFSDIEIRCSKCRTDLKVELRWSRISGFSYKISSIEEDVSGVPAGYVTP